MKRLSVATFAFSLGFTATAIAQTEVPHEFQPGQPARAAEVNENFDVLGGAIDTNAAVIAGNEAAIQANAEAISELGPSEQVLDFRSPDACVIDEPGHYVLDRSWRFEYSDNLCVATHAAGYAGQTRILISAHDVVFDMRGHSIETETILGGDMTITALQVTSRDVSVRDGWIAADYDWKFSGTSIYAPDAVRLSLDRIVTGRLSGGDGTHIRNSFFNDARVGKDSVIFASSFSTTDYENTSLSISGSNVRVEQCRIVGLAMTGAGHLVTNNTIVGNMAGEAIYVLAEGAVVEGNIVEMHGSGIGVHVAADNSTISRNTIVAYQTPDATAIRVDGSGNVIELNKTLRPNSRWPYSIALGIEFVQTGNYYGGNKIHAALPFLGAESQTDWGGNVSY